MNLKEVTCKNKKAQTLRKLPTYE